MKQYEKKEKVIEERVMDERVTEVQFPSSNVIHDEALVQEFERGIGSQVFILTPSFPFVFIGEITAVAGDNVVVDVQTTTIGELENRIWSIHIDRIEVFYIEQEGLPQIPELRDDM
ncbi:hypothetical protein [Priestia filamentosa]|uniref:hypothetical protein n=1 Tax=Priestia filamentosa TaxID=1402861 RepID=UPI003981F83F